MLEGGTLRAALGPGGADGVFGRAVAAQAEVEGEAIRAGLVEAFGGEAALVEVGVEWEEVVIRCVGLPEGGPRNLREGLDRFLNVLEAAQPGSADKNGDD